MRIKKLEIKGFKSFPDKTVLEFKPGISAVVGPNGCGKSNVFEAVRWVMGEQRVKSLRGKKMSDVIFNGSETRKPLGMAEVVMVLSNTDGPRHPSMSDYDEIMITRRLYRDGQSQYELNNVSCRLSDIVDFFLDTGVGKNSYAIIEQGRVEMVVAAKPEERRVLIEEAAGISRYKARKEAAIKKLEDTRQNLVRISDVIGEVKRHANSLKRQAAKAERYRVLSDRLKELEISLHAHNCARLFVDLDSINGQLDAHRSARVEKESKFSESHAELEAQRLRALETEKALKDALEIRHKIDIELTTVRGRIEKDKSAIVQIEEFQTRSEAQKTLLEEQEAKARLAHEELEKRKSLADQEWGAAKDELCKAKADLDAAELEVKKLQDLRDQLKDEIFNTLHETARSRNLKESLTRRRGEITFELEKKSTEAQELAGSSAKDEQLKKQTESEIQEIIGCRYDEKDKKEKYLQEKRATQERVGSLRQDLARLEKELAADKARLEALEESQKGYGAYNEGVRFLMQGDNFPEKDALLGPLAEMMDVPPEYQKALTAALGERMGHLVVASTHEGVHAADFLQQKGAGRSTFIPLDPRSDSKDGMDAVPEGLTPLKDIVRFREDCEGLGDFLLGRCYVVEDIRTAVKIWEANGIMVDLVTPGGEVLNRHGEITGGSQDNIRDEVFERRRLIEELSRKSSKLDEEIDRVQTELKDAEARIGTLNERIERCSRTLSELDVEEAGLRKDKERLEAQISRAKQRQELLHLEKDRFLTEQDGMTGEIEQAEEQIAGLEAKRQELEKDREQAAVRAEESARMLKERSAGSEGIRVLLAQLEERRSSLQREWKAAAEEQRQLKNQLARLLEEAARQAEKKTTLAQEVEAGYAREQELMQDHESITAKIDTLQADSSTLAESVSALEQLTAALGKEIQELKEKLHELEVEKVRLEQTLEGVVERVLERYRVDPRTVEPPESVPDEAEIEDIRQKIETIGEVNLAAIAESRQTEERLQFLTEQEDDLKKAVDSLYATINAINKTTKERFKDAFEEINAKFQEMFPFLFNGGEARLELTDPENLLETGVEILARPPGKRIRNMDLLSGGEKALTAVALIFSIFLIRSSPFCLLDEVDAPLDDSNLVRFNDMLRKLSRQTQFLVISHNKRSMEAADTLYGVTMEDPGASTVVSVEFIE